MEADGSGLQGCNGDFEETGRIHWQWQQKFQSKIDNLFTGYMEESGAGKEGITNYIHMLGSSHVSYYMKEHRNLYKFSQQGWGVSMKRLS
jgi:hypothetical protein